MARSAVLKPSRGIVSKGLTRRLGKSSDKIEFVLSVLEWNLRWLLSLDKDPPRSASLKLGSRTV